MRKLQVSKGVYRAVLTGVQKRDLPQTTPVVPNPHNVGRNSPCPCGSGKKFKHCHLGKGVVVEESAK